MSDERKSVKEEIGWAIHNLIAHPVSEIMYWIGLGNLGNRFHDFTVPEHKENTGRG